MYTGFHCIFFKARYCIKIVIIIIIIENNNQVVGTWIRGRLSGSFNCREGEHQKDNTDVPQRKESSTLIGYGNRAKLRIDAFFVL